MGIRFLNILGTRLIYSLFVVAGVTGWSAQAEEPAILSTAAAEIVNPLVSGASTCSTSGCHGGAEEKSLQFAVWSQRDVHSRSAATLATARSARMAEALGIPDPMTSTRCTTCHAPMQAVKTLAPAQLAPNARVSEGVSCVSCHGADGDWIRSHTRTDLTHTEKVAAGLKDLRDLHARANSCVACHQNIEPELVDKGRHPRLIFELDGQTASEPRHWRESAGYNGAQAWHVGQAVALREMSAALERGGSAVGDELRWSALLWILQRAEPDSATSSTPTARAIPTTPGGESYTSARNMIEQIARVLAANYEPATVSARLKALAATDGEFADSSVARSLHAYRAERLVLALDRLLATLPASSRPPAASARLDVLFARSQSIPDFSPKDFAVELKAFAKTLP